EERIRSEGPQPPERVLAWLEETAMALDAAHRRGIVHRDLKPANLLPDDRGEVRVADFGIASAAGFDSLTLTGTVLGTANYLSPEQAMGKRATPKSDLYALGVVAYELLSGERPFESDSATTEALAHVNAPVPSMAERRGGRAAELDGVFRRALAKDPERRYGSAREFVADLRDALADRPTALTAVFPGEEPQRRPRGYPLPLALILAAGAAGAIVAAIVASGGSDPQVVTRTV